LRVLYAFPGDSYPFEGDLPQESPGLDRRGDKVVSPWKIAFEGFIP